MFVTCVTTWPSDSGLQTRLELRQQRRRVSSQLKDPASSYLTLPARFFFLSTPRFHYALCRAQHPDNTPSVFLVIRRTKPPPTLLSVNVILHSRASTTVVISIVFVSLHRLRSEGNLSLSGTVSSPLSLNDPSLTNSYRCLRKDFATAYVYLSRIPEGICESPPPNFTRFHSLSPKQPS